MMMAQLEVKEMEVQISKLESEVMLNQAKVADITQTQPFLKLQALKTDYNRRMEEIQLRRDLAAQSNEEKLTTQQLTSATKIATTAMQTAARAEQKQSLIGQAPKKPKKKGTK
jgi:hypothetical protein